MKAAAGRIIGQLSNTEGAVCTFLSGFRRVEWREEIPTIESWADSGASGGLEAMKESSSLVRKKLVFYGRVQRVGFRYELLLLAKRLNLVGWVRNRADSAVEAEVQGEAERIRHLIEHMRSLKRASVSKIEAVRLRPVDGEDDFAVRW